MAQKENATIDADKLQPNDQVDEGVPGELETMEEVNERHRTFDFHSSVAELFY